MIIKEDSQSQKMTGVTTNNNAAVMSQTIPYDEYLNLVVDLEANLKFVTDQLSSVRDDCTAKSSEVEELHSLRREQDIAISNLREDFTLTSTERERLSCENQELIQRV